MVFSGGSTWEGLLMQHVSQHASNGNMLAGNVDNCVQMFALLGLRVRGGGRWMTYGWEEDG